MVPDWALALMLFVILAMTAVRTFNNGMKKYNKEHEALHEKLLAGEGDGTDVEMTQSAEPLVEKSPELTELLLEDSYFPCFKFSLIMAIFVGVTAMNIAKGSDSAGFTPFNIRCGSPDWWMLSLGVIPYCFFFFLWIRYITVSQYHARVAAGWEFRDGDVQWDESKTIQYPIIGVLSGVIAGMFGIGGGLINGPLMVELGFNPEVAAATGATMLLFTSTTSTIMYMLFNVLNFEYAAPLIPLGFVCTYFGQLIFNKIMAVYKRDSLIIFVIAFIVGASAILMGIEGAYVLAAKMKNPDQHPPAGFCAKPYVPDELSLDPNMHNRRGVFTPAPFSVVNVNY